MNQQLDSILEHSLAKAANPSLGEPATTKVSSKNAKIIIDVSSTRKIALLVKPVGFENASWSACPNLDPGTADAPIGSKSIVSCSKQVNTVLIPIQDLLQHLHTSGLHHRSQVR